MKDGASTPEIFKILVRFARTTRRVFAPYSKLQERILNIARTRPLHGPASRTLNMRTTPSLSNIPRIAPPTTPVEVPSEQLSIIEGTNSLSTQTLSITNPLFYPTQLRIPQRRLVRHITRQPLFHAQLEVARQLQQRKLTLLPSARPASGQIFNILGDTPRQLSRGHARLPPPLLRLETQTPPVPSLQEFGATKPVAVHVLSNARPASRSVLASQNESAVRSIPSNLSQIGRHLSQSVPSLPLVPTFYSEAIKLSKSFTSTPTLRRDVLRSQAKSQLHLNAPILEEPQSNEQIIEDPSFLTQNTPKSPKALLTETSVNDRSFALRTTPAAVGNPRANVAIEPPAPRAQIVNTVTKAPLTQQAAMLTRAAMLNFHKNALTKPAVGLSVPQSVIQPRKSTSATAQESSSQNRERLVTTFAEMETAQTKLQLTNRNPIPSLPRVELPRLSRPDAHRNGDNFAVQQTQGARPVELASNHSSQSPLMTPNTSTQEWTTPESETLADNSELRLRIAKILEEEARRYLPEE